MQLEIDGDGDLLVSRRPAPIPVRELLHPMAARGC